MANLKVECLRIHKLVSMLVTVAFAFAAVLVAAEPADATDGGALFRTKQRWWFSQAESWTDGNLNPSDGEGYGPGTPDVYHPSATARVGPATSKHPNNPPFYAPRSFIHNTTYSWACGEMATATFSCYIGYPASTAMYSYWNGKAYFGPEWGEAPETTVTIRRRTVSDGWGPTPSGMGFPSGPHSFGGVGKGPKQRVISLPYTGAGPYSVDNTIPADKLAVPTAMKTVITPTTGGCSGFPIWTDDARPIPAGYCPGTTLYDGLYSASRGGSIMIWPGSNRFGGTMRFLEGPNAQGYQLVTISGPYTSVRSYALPTSQQIPTTVPRVIGSVSAGEVLHRYRLTEPSHIYRQIVGQTPGSGTCTVRPPPYEPNGDGNCAYYRRDVRYIFTQAPYTTGMVREWQPNGNTNTLQTTSGYDNRTALGLNGIISLVQPTMTHAYLEFPSSGFANEFKPIDMSWSSVRLKKMDFIFAPEPTGTMMLAAGFVTLAGLYRLRRR